MLHQAAGALPLGMQGSAHARKRQLRASSGLLLASNP